MNATRWLKLAAFAALVYVLYDFIPSPLPDLPGDVHRVVLSALLVAVLLSGNATMAERRHARDRERQLAEENTVVLQPLPVPPPIGRMVVLMPHEPSLDGYARGYVDGLAGRPMRDGGRRVLPFRE
jgi:hypothetical protein